MTVSELNSTSNYIGLSTDTKPRAEVGSTFFETDSHITYVINEVGVWSEEGGSSVSIGNSTSTPLAGDAVFTGTAEIVAGYGGIAVTVYSDVASVAGGLSMQSSPDGVNWDSQLNVTVEAGTREPHTLAVIYKYFRIVYTNGSAAQSEFRLQVMYTTGDGKLTSRANSPITDDYDAQNVRVITDYHTDLAAGLNEDRTIVHKFGASIAIGTSYAPLTTSKVYQVPQVSGAVALRVKAGNTNDTAAGSGAREVTLEGVDETGTYTTEALATAGTSASALTSTTWLRLYRIYVSASGTYASASAGSHAAAIVIETSGGVEWGSIDATGFPKGQSQIGAYTVPLGFTGYLREYHLTVTTSGTKTVDFIMFQRQNFLETAAPYSGMRAIHELYGMSGAVDFEYKIPYQLPALTDFGFMCKGASTPDVTCEFLIELVKTH
tara:strand:- start:25764 stop:27068 length:1305 start_codon:yes stop_codon:yes gene_type:complete